MSFPVYLNQILRAVARGDATEHTYRPALKALMESLDKDVVVTNEPKRVACGAPDFIITKQNVTLGHIETKELGEDLDAVIKSEQLKRYLGGLPNLILTNYLEFRWYVLGEHRLTATLGRSVKGKVVEEQKNEVENVEALLRTFLDADIPTIGDAKELAARMAATAKIIRISIDEAFKQDDRGGRLREQLEAFREVLLHDLTESQFSDMYAQTIAYGLFAAYVAHCQNNAPKTFSRATAALALPKTNPFLRKVFSEIAGADLDERVVWAVEDLILLLKRARMAEVLTHFGRRTRQEDPVVHFYETFLAAYDPELREARGVYYTPEPVVSYIVRSVDHILKADFGLKDGLADSSKTVIQDKDGNEKQAHKVLVLDPATGTGTFLHGVIGQIHEGFGNNKGMWSSYVRHHLLPRIFGFELLMAPYAIAHMKLAMQLKETGYDFEGDDRLGVYLTNTLEEARKVSDLVFARWLSDEAQAASAVKRDLPIMVILGNPPYSGHSANKGEWMANLLRGRDTFSRQATANYFEVDGQPLGERNSKWLNDDYVKFIRFAQWRIERTGGGILAFISNNGYLDNPTFRGMRQALMKTFDDIYILDLHGNSNKKERAPDGGKDENVFDIRQGVAIGIFVKHPGRTSGCVVRHAELWGPRAIEGGKGDSNRLTGGKYHWLGNHDIRTTGWERLRPTSPHYLFARQNTRRIGEYETGWRIADAMPVNVLGFQTHRDDFAIAFDEETILKRIAALRDGRISEQELRVKYGLNDNRDWQLAHARATALADTRWKSKITRCVYRPFDQRWCYFSTVAMDYPRTELMQHVAGKHNLCLNAVRQTRMDSWQHVIASSCPAPAVFVELKDGSNVFPLYLYPNGKSHADLFDHDNGRRPNFSARFIENIENKLRMLNFIPDGKGDLKKSFGPEDVFHYMYAVFYAPSYRSRYAEFLKVDFPRLPLTGDLKLFRKLCILGAKLVGLHVMDEAPPRKSMPKFPVKGDNLIEKPRYTVPGKAAGSGRVWINKDQYFEPVSPEIWEFHIGGYQAAEKWLKDRKGRHLDFDDLDRYIRIIASLSETMRLMAEIDQMIVAHGGWPLK